MISDLFILSLKQSSSSSNQQLQALKDFGKTPVFTDLAVYSGASMSHVSSTTGERYDSYGEIWTSSTQDNRVYTVGCNGYDSYSYNSSKSPVIRPAIKISPDLLSSLPNRVIENGITEVEFGEYPQTRASDEIEKIIIEKIKDKTIETTSKTYTLDREYEEITYDGKKYIAFLSNIDRDLKLKDGTEYPKKRIVIIEVKPVKWIYDEKTDMLISKDGLLSGIEFGSDHHIRYRTTSSKQSPFQSLSGTGLFAINPGLYYADKSLYGNDQKSIYKTHIEYKDFYCSKLYEFLNKHMLLDMLSEEKDISLKSEEDIDSFTM